MEMDKRMKEWVAALRAADAAAVYQRRKGSRAGLFGLRGTYALGGVVGETCSICDRQSREIASILAQLTRLKCEPIISEEPQLPQKRSVSAATMPKGTVDRISHCRGILPVKAARDKTGPSTKPLALLLKGACTVDRLCEISTTSCPG